MKRAAEPAGAATRWGQWVSVIRHWARQRPANDAIGLALGGGFARAIAHIGVLRILEQNQIPIHYIAGVSAGAVVAAAYASGTSPDEIAKAAAAMRFTDVARFSFPKMGLVRSERMEAFLRRLLKCGHFEEMKIPLGVVATNLSSGLPVFFRGRGGVYLPIRASCSYPGLFQPVRQDGKLLIDGAMSMEVPAALLRKMGATRVIAVHVPMQKGDAIEPRNVFQVLNRSFQIMQTRTETAWRRHADLVIQPNVTGVTWDAFASTATLIAAGEQAAIEALPKIRGWLPLAKATTPDAQRAILTPGS